MRHFAERRVVAFDLSGHGDSARRDAYRVADWADEIEAVIRTRGRERVTLVSHSMGGRAGAVLAARAPKLLRSAIFIDSVLPTHDAEPMPPVTPPRIYSTRAEAVSRFRLSPPSGHTPQTTIDFLADASVVATEGGWTWKFDPRVFGMLDPERVNEAIPRIATPVGLVLARESPVTKIEDTEAFMALLGRPVPVRVLGDVGHHPMLDDPELTARTILEFATELEGIATQAR